MNIFSKIGRRITMNFAQKLIAGFIERSCKSYVSTIFGLLCIGVFAFNTFSTMIPAQYHDAANALAELVGGVALILAHDNKLPSGDVPVIKKLSVLVFVLLFGFCLPSSAQTAPAPAPSAFAAQSGPLAFHYNGQWSAASLTAERYDLLDFGANKGNRIFIDGVQVIAPTPGINIYMGGIEYHPSLTSLMKNVNVPAGSFGVFIDGAFGNATFSDGPSRLSWAAGGGVAYKVTGSLTWQPLLVNYGRVGNSPFVAMSTQLSFAFGSK